MLEIRNLTMPRKDGTTSPLTFSVAPGQATAVLGIQDAGKTTLLDMITGNLPVAPGQVLICSNDLATDATQAKGCFGYMPAQPPLYDDLTVRGYLKFIGDARGLGSKRTGERITELLELLSLRAIADKPLRGLAIGAQRMVSLAQALMANPKVLILDEPTANLDAKEIVEMRALIRTLRQDYALLIATQIVNEVAALCDEVLVLSDGEIVARGAPDDLANLAMETQALYLRVKGDEGTVRTALEGVQGTTLESVETVAAYCVNVRIIPKTGEAGREAIFWALSKAGCPILEMRPEHKGLDALLLAMVNERFDAEKGDAHA